MHKDEEAEYILFAKIGITLQIYKEDGSIKIFKNLFADIDDDITFNLEELKAIYETAKQIKESYDKNG